MSLALRRALGGLGGATGVLPVLPVARQLATDLAGPALLPGRMMAAGDVKAATFAEAAVLVLLVPAAAFVFGRVLPDAIRWRGGHAVALPGIVMGSALLLWRSGASPGASVLSALVPSLGIALASAFGPSLLGRASPQPPGDAPGTPAGRAEDAGPERIPLALALALIFLFAATLRMFWRPYGPIDLFEQGAMLAPAQVYLSAGAPYRDTYPVHGWGSDGGLDGLLFRLFAPTIETLHWRHAVVTALGVTLLGLSCWILFRRTLWSVTAFLLAMGLCPIPSDRQAAAFAGLAASIHAARVGSRRAWALAGGVSAAALFYSLDFGIFLLAAAAATAASLAAVGRNWKAAGALLWLGAGAALGSAPFLAALARDRALGAFVEVSFLSLPSRISEIWSVPAPSSASLLREGGGRAVLETLLRGTGVPWFFHAVVLAVAAAVLLFRAAGPGLSAADRGAVAATWFSVVALRGALGRADSGHLALYGVFVALPAAWLVYRAARATHAPWLWAPALSIALVVRIEPQRYPFIAWWLMQRPVGPADCRRAIPRSGAATVPCAQAEDLEALRAVVDRELSEGQTFFDFGNEPALYFLLDRRPPVRYGSVPFYEGEAEEREVIAALEREKPPLAILASGTELDRFDGVPSRVRAPRVAEYLDRHYAPAGRVGTRLLGRRRAGP